MRLIPNIKGKIMSALIPDDIKENCTAFFLLLADGLDETYFEDFVTQDVSLWVSIIPLPLKEAWIENVGKFTYLIKLADTEMILGWITDARPDLKTLMNTTQGRMWFYRQWTEIMREIGVE